MPIPEYTLHLEDIIVKFTSLKQSKVPNKPDGTLEENILLVIRENPSTTQSQIASRLGCSERKVKRIMKNMIVEGIIEHAGGRKMGKWIEK